jgi:hypothetical protein
VVSQLDVGKKNIQKFGTKNIQKFGTFSSWLMKSKAISKHVAPN